MTTTYQKPQKIQGVTTGVARVRLDYGDLSAAATSEVLTWAEIVAAHPVGAEAPPANARIIDAWANLIEEFSGGAVSACTVKLGDAGDDDELLAADDIFTGAGAGLTMKSGTYTLGTFEASYTPIVTITTTDANVDALTAGSLELAIRYEAIDTATVVR